MKRNLKILFFIFILIFSIGFLYINGQEHTVIINNKFQNKKLSEKIEIIFPNEKPKKINPNKKAIMDIKGYKTTFILKNKNFEKKYNLSLPLNKSIEIDIEKLLNKNEKWYKEISLY